MEENKTPKVEILEGSDAARVLQGAKKTVATEETTMTELQKLEESLHRTQQEVSQLHQILRQDRETMTTIDAAALLAVILASKGKPINAPYNLNGKEAKIALEGIGAMRQTSEYFSLLVAKLRVELLLEAGKITEEEADIEIPEEEQEKMAEYESWVSQFTAKEKNAIKKRIGESMEAEDKAAEAYKAEMKKAAEEASGTDSK